MSDQDRLGRDMLRTATAIRDVTECGVRVYTYLDRNEITAENLMDQVKVMFNAFGGQHEREKGRLRTIDAGRHRVKAGMVGGGRTYGYTNRPTAGADEKRRRSVYVIDETQAAVVRRIFREVADGKSMKRICQGLMADGVAPPARKNSKGWFGGTVRRIARNEMYRGRILWGRRETVRRKGTKGFRQRAPDQVLPVEHPELAIVDDALWRAANDALAKKAEVYQRGPRGRLLGRPEGTLAAAFLLTGISACTCGGSIRLVRRTHHASAPAFYGCAIHLTRGPLGCANDLIIPMEEADHLVIEALAQDVLQPRLVERYLSDAAAAWRAATVPADQRRKALEADLAAVDREIAKLEADLAGGAPWQLIRGPIEERKARRVNLAARLASEAGLAQVSAGADSLRADLETRLRDWTGLLRRQPVHARQIMRKLLDGKIQFHPFNDARGRGYDIRGKAVYGRLLAGVLPEAHSVNSGWRTPIPSTESTRR
jgi:site-specific DNA recombinase